MDGEPDESWTHSAIADSADSVRRVLAERNIRLHRDSVLSKILRQPLALESDREHETLDVHRIVESAYALRICTAILEVATDEAAQELLRRIAGGDVNIGGRDPAQAKDALWELELLASLRKHGVTADLVEPPDLVVRLPRGDVGVACKKIYSERGAEAQLRSGCKQLARFGGFGIVAMNIDNFVPADVILQVSNREAASSTLQRINLMFIQRQKGKFERFMLEGRCHGILVSCASLADIGEMRVAFNTMHESTVWTIPDLGTANRALLQDLAIALTKPSVS